MKDQLQYYLFHLLLICFQYHLLIFHFKFANSEFITIIASNASYIVVTNAIFITTCRMLILDLIYSIFKLVIFQLDLVEISFLIQVYFPFLLKILFFYCFFKKWYSISFIPLSFHIFKRLIFNFWKCYLSLMISYLASIPSYSKNQYLMALQYLMSFLFFNFFFYFHEQI